MSATSTETKREEGHIRNEVWRTLTPGQQIAELDRRLGPGQGAKRQRAAIVKRCADAVVAQKGQTA